MPSLKELNQKFIERKIKTQKMGGDIEVAKQKAQKKLTVRERIQILFDPQTFVEQGILAEHNSNDPDMAGKSTPADGVVSGVGQIFGRSVAVIAYDFTVIAGTIGEVNERKAKRMRAWSATMRIPLVWLLDSAGARIQEIASSRFAMTGELFYDQVALSGVVPQVAAMMGPCAAGTAYIAGLADFVPMVKGTSSIALAGPPLVKAAIGEDISAENLGGSRVHCDISGVGDLEVNDDKACLEVVRKYLSFFPSHSGEKPPRATVKKTSEDVSSRLAKALSGQNPNDETLDDSILEILPDNPRKHYDMRSILTKVVDGGDLLELKPNFGKGLITALARIGGNALGIVASQPSYMGGVINIDESDKAARFINLCDAFNIPLVFFQDVPGFMVGSKVEHAGIIRHGAKMLYAVSRASVPKITVVIRKAYGAGYYVMCGRAFGADKIVAWPSAEISLMGAEGGVNIIFRKDIAKAADPEKRRQELVAEYGQKISLDVAAQGAYIDDVIDPRDTRKIILETLHLTSQKQIPLPQRKHGVMPV